MILRGWILAVLACVLSPAIGLSQTPEIQQKLERDLAHKRLQGTWIPDLLLTPGGAEAYPLKGRVLAIDGDRFIRIEGKHAVASGTFKIEPGLLRLTVTDRSPWDLEMADARTTVAYAFKVDGDVLTLGYSADGKSRPANLTPGEGRQVVLYKRVVSDRPVPAVPARR